MNDEYLTKVLIEDDDKEDLLGKIVAVSASLPLPRQGSRRGMKGRSEVSRRERCKSRYERTRERRREKKRRERAMRERLNEERVDKEIVTWNVQGMSVRGRNRDTLRTVVEKIEKER